MTDVQCDAEKTNCHLKCRIVGGNSSCLLQSLLWTGDKELNQFNIFVFWLDGF